MLGTIMWVPSIPSLRKLVPKSLVLSLVRYFPPRSAGVRTALAPLRSAPGLVLVLGQATAAGKARDLERERLVRKTAGVISRPVHGKSAVSVINEAGQAPAVGATRGSPLIGAGGGGRSHSAAKHKGQARRVICIVDTK